MEQKLMRSKNERYLAGVLGGMAGYLNVDPTLVRLVFVLFGLAKPPVALAVYLLLWLVLPETDDIKTANP